MANSRKIFLVVGGCLVAASGARIPVLVDSGGVDLLVVLLALVGNLAER